MKTASILLAFALASVSLAGCALAPSDVNADGTPHDPNGTDSNTTVTTVGKTANTTTVVTAQPASASSGDVVIATQAVTPPVPSVVSTSVAIPAPAVSPGTLVSCYSFDVATTSDGSTVGVCAPTTATGKPRYLRAYSIVSVVSPVTGDETSILVGIE